MFFLIVYLQNKVIPLVIKTQVKDEFSEPKDEKKDFLLNSGIGHIILFSLHCSMTCWNSFSEACTMEHKGGL